MAKTVFVDGQVLTAQVMNALNNPVFVQTTPDNDGEIAAITDADLTDAAGNLKPVSYAFFDALKVSQGASGLQLTHEAGSVLQEDRTIAVIPAASILALDDTTSFVHVNTEGDVDVLEALPTRSLPMARVVASAGSISLIEDLRPRFSLLPATETVFALGGNGSEGIKVISGNETLDRGEYYFESLLIEDTAIVTVSKFARIRVKGDCIINGQINVTQAINGGAGFATNSTSNIGGLTGSGPGGGSGTGTAGTYSFALAEYGSGGGSGFFRSDAGATGTIATGGQGGGGLVLEVGGDVQIGSAATIQAVGSAGVSVTGVAQTNISGAGGGSGGLFLIKSPKTVTVEASATINVSGGNGGNAASGNSLGGGGGGGGQFVIICPTISTAGAIVNVAGGAPGNSLGTSLLGGGTGGSFGGFGGLSAATALPGAAGLFLTRNFIPA